jgi:2-succinyl-6-hydroxy-2,4-cyclohexadiene-1-carboxylate synthase
VLSVRRRGKGPGLALVHGFTQTSRSWETIAPALATRHALTMVDLPGHGRSEVAAADLWEAARLVSDAAGPGAYLGYSMGGRLCLHVALQSPETVSRLVLVGADGGIEDDRERAERRAADERLARRLEEIGVERFVDEWLAQPLFAGLSADQAGRSARLANSVAGLAHALRRLGTGTQRPLWDRLAELRMPVLVVAGERDSKFAALGRRMVAAIGSCATLALIPGAGHACHLEAPDAFVEVVSPWLDHDSAIPSASSPP